MSSAVKEFTLEVPANNQAIHRLMWRIMDEAENGDERINLHFGTCSLLCDDEQEREEHRNNVTANYALAVLRASMSECSCAGGAGDDEGSQ